MNIFTFVLKAGIGNIFKTDKLRGKLSLNAIEYGLNLENFKIDGIEKFFLWLFWTLGNVLNSFETAAGLCNRILLMASEY